MSLPVWGAWIETFMTLPQEIKTSRSPCGERGLKLGFEEKLRFFSTVARRVGSVD